MNKLLELIENAKNIAKGLRAESCSLAKYLK